MSFLSSNEFRLLFTLILLAAMIGGAGRFVMRRVAGDWAERAADLFWIVFVVQYLAVGIPGILGVLSPLTIALTTLALSATLFFWPAAANKIESPPVEKPTTADRWTLLLGVLFFAGFCAGVMLQQRVLPVMANDALTYHVPAAIQWLNTGRIGLHQTWFFNPANTYSPLAGSMFIAWWSAPLGFELLAKYVQFWALALIFFSLIRLMRQMDVRVVIAVPVALAIVLAQPMARHAAMEKDDLYLAGFFLAAVAGFGPRRVGDRLGPWRICCTLALMLATKYTALLALPLFVLLLDAPYRAKWNWRQHAIVPAMIVLLAGPWYLRNWMLTGNPLYPLDVAIGPLRLFNGMFTTTRSAEFTGIGPIWNVLTGRDQSLPARAILSTGLAWLAAFAGCFKRVRSNPLVRVCLLGPPVALAIFVLLSPYPEARFVYPAFLLLYAGAALAIARVIKPAWGKGLAIVIIFACSAGSGIIPEQLAMFSLIGALTALLGAGIAAILAWQHQRRRELAAYLGLAGAAAVGVAIYAGTPALVHDYIDLCWEAWRTPYGATAELWEHIDEQVGTPSYDPPAGPRRIVACTNTCLYLPMMGLRHQREVVYIPTRKNVRYLHELGHIDRPLSGEQITPAVIARMLEDVDAGQWLQRLEASGAGHVVVYSSGTKWPVELAIIEKHPERFQLVVQNKSGKLYRFQPAKQRD